MFVLNGYEAEVVAESNGFDRNAPVGSMLNDAQAQRIGAALAPLLL